MRVALFVLFTICTVVGLGGGANASTSIALDGDYFGSWTFFIVSNGRAGLGAGGVDPSAASGLTSVSLATEGPAPSGIILGGQGPIYFANSAGDCLTGTFPGMSNWGNTTTFQITGGTGAFAGAHGGGDLIVINTFPSPTGILTGPSRILVHGAASIPSPVPEPSSMALRLGPGCLGMFALRRNRRRSRNASPPSSRTRS